MLLPWWPTLVWNVSSTAGTCYRIPNGFNGKRLSLMQNLSDTYSDCREHSPLGEVSLNGQSPVLLVWIQFVHYTQKQLLCQSNPVLLNWRPCVQWFFPQWRLYSSNCQAWGLCRHVLENDIKSIQQRSNLNIKLLGQAIRLSYIWIIFNQTCLLWINWSCT